MRIAFGHTIWFVEYQACGFQLQELTDKGSHTTRVMDHHKLALAAETVKLIDHLSWLHAADPENRTADLRERLAFRAAVEVKRTHPEVTLLLGDIEILRRYRIVIDGTYSYCSVVCEAGSIVDTNGLIRFFPLRGFTHRMFTRWCASMDRAFNEGAWDAASDDTRAGARIAGLHLFGLILARRLAADVADLADVVYTCDVCGYGEPILTIDL